MNRDPFTDHWLDRFADALRHYPLPMGVILFAAVVVLGFAAGELGWAAKMTWGH